MQYLVILSGANVFFETSVGDAPMGDLVIGFIACHLVTAPTDELAVAHAKRNLLVNWNQNFNANRKFGMPSLTIEKMMRLDRSPIPKITQDYFWFRTPEEKDELLEKLSQQPKPWFWQKPAQNICVNGFNNRENAHGL